MERPAQKKTAKTVVVFDYGFGNVRSAERALEKVGAEVEITADFEKSVAADGLLVPGVGAFASCMEGLKRAGGDRVIRKRLELNKKVLGVCVGMQILFDRGTEGDGAVGLGLFRGAVSELPLKVSPHIGWSGVSLTSSDSSSEFAVRENLYFVHSFGVDAASAKKDNPEALIKVCEVEGSSGNPVEFVASIERGNIFGCQFHPEKSGEVGLQLLRNWVEGL